MRFGTNHRRPLVALGLFAGLLAGPLSFGLAQQPRLNEYSVEPALHADDKGDIWTMHFRFKPPRVITAEVPGRGKKIIWYMWYQVINRTGEPRTFIPEFELKTNDRFTVHMDEILPSVQKQIQSLEDPTGRLDIKNSVTIFKDPILPTKPDSAPRAVTGVAIWSDVYDRASDTNYFSIFVSGLSDGWSEDENGIIRRKTLRLDFRRLTAGGPDRPTDIRYTEQSEWIYRASSVNLKDDGADAPPPKNDQ